MSEFYPVCLPDDVSQLCSELCSKLCSITGTTGSSAASHFFRSPLETGRVSAADLSCVAAGQELGSVEGGAATVSVSSTGLWALRFWLSLRRICFFSLCYQREKKQHIKYCKILDLAQQRKQTTAGLLEVYLDAGGRLWFREGFFERRYLVKTKENNNDKTEC